MQQGKRAQRRWKWFHRSRNGQRNRQRHEKQRYKSESSSRIRWRISETEKNTRQQHSPYNTSWFSSTDQTSNNKSPPSAFATRISSGTFVKGLSSFWEFSKSVYIKNSEHIVPTYILSIQKLHLFVTVYYSSHWQTPPCEPDLPQMLGIWKA